MKTTRFPENRTSQNIAPRFTQRCLATCRALVAELRRFKSLLADEYRDAFREQRQLLDLVLNEAEALAWQTDYPHLLFPVLATEKIEAAVAWRQRQESLAHRSPQWALAE